jgi:thymidine kinase
MQSSGHIELILGPMFSGKSSEMMRKVRRYQHARKSCLVVNFLRDNRYSFEDVASTHDKYAIGYPRITIKATKAATLRELLPKALLHDVIAVDEGQFFPDVVEVSEELANAGKVVIIAALDGTFQRKPFG